MLLVNFFDLILYIEQDVDFKWPQCSGLKN